ncbi:MAG: hypothetical protein HXS50_01610 [Theionarchaea archaeon]|nr:hypothetical protein [Theionarchaea archaeon]
MKITAFAIFAILILFYFPIAQSQSPVSVLYTGDPYPGHTPYIHMKVEPMLAVTPIQASRDHYAGISDSDIKRAIRIYMPRTYDDLIETYDVLIISDSNVGSFTSEQHAWFPQSVADDGMGLAMFGGHETFGAATGHPDWGKAPIGKALPIETIAGEYHDGKVEVQETDNVFMKSLPWRSDLDFLQNYASNLGVLREGAEMLAVDTIKSGRYAGYENPFYSTWKYQNGRTFAHTGDWTPGGGVVFLRWEYLPDFATNLMLYLSGRDIPEDLDLVHTVRSRFATLGYRRLIIDSLVDFVERFGANPKRVLDVIGEVDEARFEAQELYLELSFEEALDAVDNALGLMDQAEIVAEDVKNDALLWVYLTEWLSVSGTALIVGFLLWTLMVRRRLYREVKTTTFRG